jgi:outer membrane protein
MGGILKRGIVAILAALIAMALPPAAPAEDIADIGFVDQASLSSIPSFTNANKQLASFKAGLDRQFVKRMRGVKDRNIQARIAQEFQNKLADRQRDLFAPLFERARVAIASVASSKNLSVVVDKRIIVFGGRDITSGVIDLLNGPGDPIPPVNTPPPSNVGYVDQTQIDSVPKLRSANDEFQKFQQQQQQQAQAKMKNAKNDGDRQQVLKDYQTAIADKQKQLIQPLVDQTRSIISDVAKKRGLVLVIDRANLIYGGTDITSDVTSAFK